jgi:hypothetical protein
MASERSGEDGKNKIVEANSWQILLVSRFAVQFQAEIYLAIREITEGISRIWLEHKRNH